MPIYSIQTEKKITPTQIDKILRGNGITLLDIISNDDKKSHVIKTNAYIDGSIAAALAWQYGQCLCTQEENYDFPATQPSTAPSNPTLKERLLSILERWGRIKPRRNWRLH